MDPELEAAAEGEALAAATAPDGSRAVVLTRMPSGHELHRICERKEDGWAPADNDPACTAGTCWTDGVWHVSGQVPAGIRAVKLRFQGEDREVPVEDRRYLAAWWDLPESAAEDEPELVAYIWTDGLETPILA